VVVDDVLDHTETSLVARVDEELVDGWSAVGLVHRVPQHAVVTPVVRAVERVDGQQLDEVDAQVNEVVEPFDRALERAIGGERADVHLVDDAAGELQPGPVLVAPLVQRRVEDARQPVHPMRLAAGARVGQGGVVRVDEVPVVAAVSGLDGFRRMPPAAGIPGHVQRMPVELQPHALGQGRPDLESAHSDTASSATG
jgi:hypothetical protein